LFAHKHTLGLN